jgi:hypothetical protein
LNTFIPFTPFGLLGFWAFGLLAFGFWLLAFGFWLLAFGFWLFNIMDRQKAQTLTT